MPQFDKVSPFYDSFMKLMGLYREEKLLKFMNLKGTEIVIDIGGGTGYLTYKIAEKTKLVYLIDESEKMALRAPKSSRIKTLICDILQNPLEAGIADVILISDVFHHIEEQEKLAEEIKRLLKNNGVIIIHDFDISDIRTRILNAFEFLLFGKLYFRTRQYFQDLFTSRGFTIEDVYDKGYYYIIKGKKNV